MIGTGNHGFNALQVILASGFSGLTELGLIPESVAALAALPEQVRLVRADESVNFHLSENKTDPIRRDTTIYRWLVEIAPSVVVAPDYWLRGTKPQHFQLFKRVSAPRAYPQKEFAHLFVKFVSPLTAKSGAPELWVSSAALHDERAARRILKKAVALSSNNALHRTAVSDIVGA